MWFIVHVFYVKVEIIQVPNHVTDDRCVTLRMLRKQRELLKLRYVYATLR